MRRPTCFAPTRLAPAAVVLCLAAALTGCGHSGGGGAPSASPSATSAGPTAPRIAIKDFVFRPAALTVRPGAKVTVVNEDDVAHTVTATGAKPFDTGTVAPGRSATFTAPAKAGDYPYICAIHPNMKGTLTVR
ncbi:cupredoxin domain-containing protein [Streptomyces sp. NPDC058000]|uniref:cupredoxin domain-containing protein n=1 Tax=Streptomyces sp. NPDC058000 TaxID=3346299 RepID=UPI0036E761DF